VLRTFPICIAVDSLPVSRKFEEYLGKTEDGACLISFPNRAGVLTMIVPPYQAEL
jgi:hypothetical protein